MLHKLLKKFDKEPENKTNFFVLSSESDFYLFIQQHQHLEKEIKTLLNKDPINDKVLQKIYQWLQLKNVLNMQRVCSAFYFGNLFYLDDSHHPETIAHAPSRKSFTHFTTSTMFEPLYSVKYVLGRFILNNDIEYILSAKCKPSEALYELLASKTSFECRGSCQIASYLTLLDLHKLLYGEAKGRSAFDDLFTNSDNKNGHDFHRLRIGAMGDVTSTTHQEKYPEEFSSIYFFTHYKCDITLNELQKHPQKYIGMNFYIKGHDNYPLKHPTGPAQGWNAVFAGLHPKGEPLFLLARNQGERNLLTYSEITSLLNKEYNRLPHLSECKQAQLTSHNNEIKGLQSLRWFFDINKIKLLITQPNVFKSNLLDYINHFYQSIFRKNGWHSLDNITSARYRSVGEFVNQSFDRQTKDDTFLYANKLFGKQKIASKSIERAQDDCLSALNKKIG